MEQTSSLLAFFFVQIRQGKSISSSVHKPKQNEEEREAEKRRQVDVRGEIEPSQGGKSIWQVQ